MPVIRGVKIKLSPTPEQARVMDRWRRETIALWNLLLGMEQAAYDGSKFRPELRWRDIWADVVRDGYETSVKVWKYGKVKKNGELARSSKTGKVRGPGEGKEPVEPTPEYYAKIAAAVAQPSLFIWESDLQKIMARLKNNPLTAWINVLPSHAAQQVCKDVVKAINAMLTERKKRTGGTGGQNTGFPRFKKSNYAVGSVYMVKSQTEFDHDARSVWIPKIKTPIRFRQEGVPLDGELQGGRIWRQGEQWWLSCQFKEPDQAPLPKRGRECGLKVAASVLATTFDGEIVQQTAPVVEDRRLTRRIKLAGRRLARRHKGTKDYYEAANELATLHAKERNRRNDNLHKVSREIVNSFDSITVHRMDVKSLMVTNKFNPESGAVERTPKSLTRANRRAAMARFRTYIKYKAVDGGRVYNETHTYFPEVQKCNQCGKLHAMPLDKRTLKCDCGYVMERRANAAMNEFEQGQIAKEFGKL